MGCNASRSNNAVLEVVPWETLQDIDIDADLDLGDSNCNNVNRNSKMHLRPPSRKNSDAIATIETNQGFSMVYPKLFHLHRKKRSRDSKSTSNRFRFHFPTAESTTESTEQEALDEDPTTSLYESSSFDSPTIVCNPSEEESDSNSKEETRFDNAITISWNDKLRNKRISRSRSRSKLGFTNFKLQKRRNNATININSSGDGEDWTDSKWNLSNWNVKHRISIRRRGRRSPKTYGLGAAKEYYFSNNKKNQTFVFESGSEVESGNNNNFSPLSEGNSNNYDGFLKFEDSHRELARSLL
jgi:hypothetical protein